MYKVIKIGGRDYHLEYSIEASLYSDCVEDMTSMFGSVILIDDDKMNVKDKLREMCSGMASIPSVTLTVFYAGLMEAHGDHPDGDGTVPNIATAKQLIKQYILEHKDDDTGNFYGVLELCLAQMADNGFFELIGLEKMFGEKEPKKQAKVPQDHKKQSKKASEK